jgi:hypothetical protein
MSTEERLHDKREARIAAGREAWAHLQKHEHFKDWLAIADAIAAVREEAMSLAHSNTPQGPPYRAAYRRIIEGREPWIAGINEATRSHCCWLVDNLPAVMTWRETLTFEQRDTWNHPTTIRRQYERSHQAKEPKAEETDLLTPLQQAKQKIIELQEENDKLRRQVKAMQNEGSLFDIKQDTPSMIARVIAAHVGRTKRFEIAKLLKEAPAG